MFPSSVAFFVVLFFPSTLAIIHSVCYDHFLETNGCVFSSADGQSRCPAPPNPDPDPTVLFRPKPNTDNQKRGMHQRLTRGYDDFEKSFYVAGGAGICGSYDTNKDDGVCLWTGTSDEGSDISTAGWLNGVDVYNCQKRVYVQRRGHPETRIRTVVKDGCTFNTKDKDTGCFQIALTNKTFLAFNPTEEELAQGGLKDINWDFDNSEGFNPRDGPI